MRKMEVKWEENNFFKLTINFNILVVVVRELIYIKTLNHLKLLSIIIDV